jgi:hypothetical protein
MLGIGRYYIGLAAVGDYELVADLEQTRWRYQAGANIAKRILEIARLHFRQKLNLIFT